MGSIFYTEYKGLRNRKSLFGDIMKYQKWGSSFEQYKNNLKKGTVERPVVKVWTGR